MKIGKKVVALFLGSLLSVGIINANEVKKVDQVTTGVSVTTDVDFTITGTEPFASMASVDLTNTEHAVLIIQEIKPSTVIKNWLDHVYIKGEKAKDGVNCQVKMYGRGTIILPYSKDIRPLVCYTGQNFSGKSCEDYTEGHNGNGFMKTLTTATLDNQIRSFKLKRGYMVTFALGKEGWGYSRCFIADNEDLEVNLPVNMSGRISSYRLFKWQNAKKGNLASSEYKYLNLVNATAGFDWGEGHNLLPDMECVPNHIYEDFPTVSTIGKVTWSCHSKNNNEPGNSADDTPQSVETVLGNWQNVMRTGLRLCSESSHDGSMGHLQAFLDSVDARGWRCDIIDMHCYWTQGQFDNLINISKRYGNRPIWISEWLWGAWWSGKGIFAVVKDKSDFSENAQKMLLDGTKPILEKLNSNPCVERYFYWNAEERTSLWSKDGADTLSLLGKYYSNMREPLAFNRKYEYIPKVVYRTTTNLSVQTVPQSNEVILRWDDPNGDMLDSMVVMCKRPGETQYKSIANIPLNEINSVKGASYQYIDKPLNGTNKYHIAIYPIGDNKPRVSNSVSSLVISNKAKWNDVTDDYIVNAGFDNPKDYTNSIGTGKNNHKDTEGWTTDTKDANGCSAAFKVGSNNTLNGKKIPSLNAEKAAQGGVLGVNQGWEQPICYTQKFKLSAGTYRLSYAVYNAANIIETENLCGYKIGDQSYVYDYYTSMEPNEWNISTFIPFTLMEESEITLSLGYRAAGCKSTGNPCFFYDYVKLEKADLSEVDDAGPEDIYVNVTDELLKNPGFDYSNDFLKANLGNGTSSHKNATSWTTANTDQNGSSGVFAIGSKYTLNGKNVPSTNVTGKTAGGTLGISQGWGVENSYKQSVTLPAGTYRMSYAIYNSANPTASFNNKCGYQIGNSTAVYDKLSKLPVGSWTTRHLEDFTLDKATKVTFSLGFSAASSTSTSNAYLFFDYIKLEKRIDKSEYVHTGITPFTHGEKPATPPIAIYDLMGNKIPTMNFGINIIKFADGSIKKVVVK